MSPPLALVLDFDGVICDAAAEGALVTWLGLHPPDPAAAVSSYLPAMPREFVHRFHAVRGYSRVLDHFVVAHRPAATRIRSQAEFDTLFATLGAGYVARFVAGANTARGRCRTEEPAFWLDLHTLYPGVAGLLTRHAGAVAIVTAKDETSVATILARHGLAGTVREIVGQCADKAQAVRALCQRYRQATSQLLFVDDNLTNLRRVQATGAATRWAMWGYHTPEDLATAAALGTTRLELAELPALRVAAGDHLPTNHRSAATTVAAGTT